MKNALIKTFASGRMACDVAYTALVSGVFDYIVGTDIKLPIGSQRLYHELCVSPNVLADEGKYIEFLELQINKLLSRGYRVYCSASIDFEYLAHLSLSNLYKDNPNVIFDVADGLKWFYNMISDKRTYPAYFGQWTLGCLGVDSEFVEGEKYYVKPISKKVFKKPFSIAGELASQYVDYDNFVVQPHIDDLSEYRVEIVANQVFVFRYCPKLDVLFFVKSDLIRDAVNDFLKRFLPEDFNAKTPIALDLFCSKSCDRFYVIDFNMRVSGLTGLLGVFGVFNYYRYLVAGDTTSYRHLEDKLIVKRKDYAVSMPYLIPAR